MARHLLSDVTIRNTKPKDKPTRLSDGDGLYLLVNPDDSRWWRLDYSINGKRKTLSLGVYPKVGLSAVRKLADEAREHIAAGTDPSDLRKAKKEQQEQVKAEEQRTQDGLPPAGSFEEVAREWMDWRQSNIAEAQNKKTLSRFEHDVFPWLGARPIDQIEAPEVLAVLRRIDGRGVRYTANKIRSEISRVFRYAIAHGKAKSDPAQPLVGAIPSAKGKNFPSITDPASVAGMLRAFDEFHGTFIVQCALKLAPMLFARPGELRKAEWRDIDLDRAEWRYVVSKTKNDHLVPLARQAVETLRELHALTGAGRYVFPGTGSAKTMSGNTINAALRRLGYDTKTEITGHGFRAMARTILHEELGHKPEVIEHQLSHAVPDALGTAYNRTKFIKERTAMMQAWADYLDNLKAGAVVIPFKRAG
jgi:integrase